MSVTAADFYAFAMRIHASATEEIDLRNVVSRTYYAAYHACLRKIAADDEQLNPRIGHAEFSRWLMDKSAGTPERALGFALNFLRQHRNNADYALDISLVQADVTTALGAYDNVMRLLPRTATPPAV